MTDTNNGRFVWYELMTTDPKAAIAFYTHVTGWKTQVFGEGQTPPGGEPYTMWVSGQGPLGGVMTLPEPAKKMGAPPHWMAHVQVANVDETVTKARKHDARVYVEPTDIPTIGRFAVIADPQGASLSVFTPSAPMTLHDVSKPGEFCWNELLTTDAPKALHFYGELFGWKKVNEHDMGPMGKYLLFGHGEPMFGGMMTKPKDNPMPPSWLYYVEVSDFDAALERAKGRGARVLNGPMEVPGGGRIVQLTDPQGAVFALHHQPAKTA
jgi:predicted enzyme related to lactoylglutathione lyase